MSARINVLRMLFPPGIAFFHVKCIPASADAQSQVRLRARQWSNVIEVATHLAAVPHGMSRKMAGRCAARAVVSTSPSTAGALRIHRGTELLGISTASLTIPLPSIAAHRLCQVPLQQLGGILSVAELLGPKPASHAARGLPGTGVVEAPRHRRARSPASVRSVAVRAGAPGPPGGRGRVPAAAHVVPAQGRGRRGRPASHRGIKNTYLHKGQRRFMCHLPARH